METHPWPRERSRLASAAALGLLLAILGLGASPASAAHIPLAYDPAAMEKSIVQLYIEWSGSVGYTDEKGKELWEIGRASCRERVL